MGAYIFFALGKFSLSFFQPFWVGRWRVTSGNVGCPVFWLFLRNRSGEDLGKASKLPLQSWVAAGLDINHKWHSPNNLITNQQSIEKLMWQEKLLGYELQDTHFTIWNLETQLFLFGLDVFLLFPKWKYTSFYKYHGKLLITKIKVLTTPKRRRK